MTRRNDLLDNVRVASPCSASWDAMEGDARERFCGQCQHSVFNLSEMSRADAERLLRERTGRLCVRYFRRADGTVMTRDCPRGLAAVRKKVALGWAFAATMVLSAFGCRVEAPQEIAGGIPPKEIVAPDPGQPTTGIAAPEHEVMGKIPSDPKPLMGEMPAEMGNVLASGGK